MKNLKLIRNRTRQDDIDDLINNIRRTALWHLMDKDYGADQYSEEDIERETKKVAIDLRVLTGRLLSLAFNERDFGQGVSRERKRVEKK